MHSAVARFLTNPDSGELAIVQRPNVPLAIFLGVTVVRVLLHPGGAAGTAISVIASAALLVWAGLEIARGDSPFRRVLGALVLVVAGVGLLTG